MDPQLSEEALLLEIEREIEDITASNQISSQLPPNSEYAYGMQRQNIDIFVDSQISFFQIFVFLMLNFFLFASPYFKQHHLHANTFFFLQLEIQRCNKFNTRLTFHQSSQCTLKTKISTQLCPTH